MTKMQDLIVEHRRALGAFVIVVNEQNRLEGDDWATRDGCMITILIAANDFGGEGFVIGHEEDDLTQKVVAEYDRHAKALYWLRSHNNQLHAEAMAKLEELRAKNLAFIGPALAAWQKKRGRIYKKEAELQAQWDKTGKAETEAALKLFLHPAANRKEEAARQKYVRETALFHGDDHYGIALMQALAGTTDLHPSIKYGPNPAYQAIEEAAE